MIFPRNIALLVAVVVLALLAFVAPTDRIRRTDVVPLIPGFDGAAVTRLVVKEGGVERVVIVRRDAGWLVENLFGAPAFTPDVSSFLSRVGAMTTLDRVGEGPSAIVDMGVSAGAGIEGDAASSAGSSGVQVKLMADDGAGLAPRTIADLVFAPASDSGVLVRVQGGDVVYRIARMPLPPVDPLRWFDSRSLIPLQDLQVSRLVASGGALGDDVVTIQRPIAVLDGRFFDAQERPVPSEHVDHVLGRLRTLFPVGVVAATSPLADTLDGTTLEVEVAPTGGKIFRLLLAPYEVGPGGEASARWRALVPGTEYVVEVEARAVDDLIAALLGAAAAAR